MKIKLIDMIKLKESLEKLYPQVESVHIKYKVKRNINILEFETKAFESIKNDLLTVDEREVFERTKNKESEEKLKEVYPNLYDIIKSLNQKFAETDKLLKEQETYILLDSLKIDELPDQIDRETMRSLKIIIKGE